jgi:hypothetical protein
VFTNRFSTDTQQDLGSELRSWNGTGSSQSSWHGPIELLSDNNQLSPLQGARGGHGGGGGGGNGGGGGTPPPTPLPGTLVGTAGGLQFDLVWDSNVASAPAGFQAAVTDAAQYLTTLYSNNILITIDVGWGEVGGATLPSGDLASSATYGYTENYSSVVAGLKTDAASSTYQASADASLLSSDPTNGGKFFVATAEAKAMGQVSGSSNSIDGFIGFSSSASWDFSATTAPTSGQYDAIGVAEHELTEVMGRIGSVGGVFGPNVYTPLDLFRYSSAGVRDLTPGPGYFSVNSGQTNLGTYNNPQNGADAADWISTLTGDSFTAVGYSGTRLALSPTDIIETSVLGYKMTPTAVALTKTPGLA